MFKLATSALIVGAAAATPVAPTAPEAYTAEVTFTIPYYGTVEHVTIANSGLSGSATQKQMVSYYDGTNLFYSDASPDGSSYEVTPIVDHVECFVSGPSPGVEVFPDLSNFELVDGTTTVNGVECNQWQLVQDDVDAYGYIGTYSMYASVEDNTPVQFHQLGHNVVLGGSHYDEYVLDYNIIDTSSPDPSVFQVADPDSCTVMETDDDTGSGGGPTSGSASRHNLDLAFPNAHADKVALFEAFEERFGKEYESQGERAERFGHFHRNLMFVNAHNLQGKSFTVGTNHMSDWTREERHALGGHVKGDEEPSVAPAYSYESKGKASATGIDWREKGAVVPVGDQGTCGSCWAWGSVGAAAGQQFLAHGDLTELSAQQLMDCGWPQGNKGCEGSTASKAYSYVLEDAAGVMDTAASYPYLNQNGFCQADTATAGTVISGYVNVTGQDFEVFNDALTTIGPLSIAIDATPDSFYFYSGGLYDDTDCLNGEDDLDHEVLAVGYGFTEDGQAYTIVQNSWSTHWGEAGVVYVAQDGNICGVSDEPVYPLVK